MDILIKSPIERFPVHFNYSVDLLVGEIVVSSVLTCVNSATGISSAATIIDSETIASPDVDVILKAGTEGDEHSIQSVVTTNLGNVYQRDLLLVIATVVTDDFSKQPADKILFDVDFSRRLESGDTILTAAILATKESDGTDVSVSIAPLVEIFSPKVGVHVADGVDLKTYLLGVRATTAAGYIYEKNIRMNVQELP